VSELVRKAEEAAGQAYAPYSGYRVGAVVRMSDGREFAGVNVENAAYPLTQCAEKTAIGAAASAGYRPGDIVEVGISASPCGGCRQWLAEMQVGRVLFRNGGRVVEMTPDELLPEQFRAVELGS